ncbi:hypothetical protein Pan241w_10040 [Gimesia alba]|uniref:Zinc-finger domain-containing protein n=1 Tax=Gimesia alba TaxID=2527973 RepID=A0A517RAP0_9PLAN|nr:hypothetical protein [Gimesia alba]QDT40945.1 hypothetical protein Pan241w_10040 [Gimesia alba]
MYCTQCNGLKSRVALAVGNDLSGAELDLLEKQLKNCEQCRSQYEELQKSYEALQKQFDSAPVPSLQDSVWPQVSAKIAARRRRNRPTQFNFLLPTLTTVACCLALLLVTNSPQTEQPTFDPVTGSPHPVGLLGFQNLNPVDNDLQNAADRQWGSPEGLLKTNSNPYGYNLPRLRHDVTNSYNLHSVKF